jgi:hypothetical protein
VTARLYWFDVYLARRRFVGPAGAEMADIERNSCMARSPLVSSRLRLTAPLALAASALIPRAASAADPTTPQKTDRNDKPAADPLAELLALIPVAVADAVEDGLIVTYGNIAAQLAAGDIEPPTSLDDEEGFDAWIHASYSILLASPWREYALVLDRELLGYDVTNIDQTIEAGQPPEMVSLLRGRFDPDAVAAAWAANGYTMSEIDGIPVATLFEDAAIDPKIEISRIALARMNNAAFLPDGTLAYAATLPLMEQAIATANGKAESLAARVDVAATLPALDRPLASAMLVSGDSLSIAAQTPVNLPDGVEVEIEPDDPMPPIAFGIIGITPGGPTLIYDEGEEPVIELPPATLVYRLLMTEPGTAGEAAEVVDARLGTMTSSRTQQPLTELFASWEATAVSDGDVLALDLLPAEGRPVTFWPQPYFSRDLLFLAW